ncbi:MAG: hypothetical protein QOF64_2133 [Candidatus Binatota bacterium]|jgi:hypothetical protein|nr:hypothetical protein [Candidatus Binatota bacterium]
MATYLTSLWSASLLLLIVIGGCNRDTSTARSVAEAFVDHHYVGIDLQKAKELTVSVALSKINDELRLTSGQSIDASTQKPRVNYTLLEKKEGDQRASFLFEGTIHSSDNTSFTRKWLVTTRKEGTEWKVSNFTESD